MKKFLSIFIVFLIFISLYGFYEKERRQTLVSDFKSNKAILCKGKIIKLDEGWMIHNNRFFTNGKKFYTIVFCKSI